MEYRRIGRWSASLILVTTLGVSLVPRPGLLRCLMMGAIVDAPCCPTEDSETSRATITADCLEHIPGAMPTIQAVSAPTRASLSASPEATLVAWSPPAASVQQHVDPRRRDTARGSPGEHRLRVPTIVLRV